MVTWTAIASGILYHPCQRHSGERRTEAKNIVGQEICCHQQPLSLLEVGDGFKREACESSEGSAETDDNQQSTARIDQHARGGPDETTSDNEAAGDIAEQRS